MSAALKWNLISEDDYLAGELISPIKNEYLGGVVYAMAGARNRHNVIKDNIHVALAVRLKGKPCRAYSSDTKVRIRTALPLRFYYPDVSVVCEPNPEDDSFHDHPVVIFEVLSNSTRRIDEGEKKDAYLTIPSLRVYALVDQESATVILFRRADAGFIREVHHGIDEILNLGEIGTKLPLAEIYDGIEPSPEPAPKEEP